MGQTTDEETRYIEWKAELDRYLSERLMGLNSDDLPDRDYRSMFADGYGADEAALEILQEEGLYD